MTCFGVPIVVFAWIWSGLVVAGCSGQADAPDHGAPDVELDSEVIVPEETLEPENDADEDPCAPWIVPPRCPSGLVRLQGECEPDPPPVIEGVELVPRCWSIVSSRPEVPGRILSGLAAEDERIYFVSTRDDMWPRTFLHAVDTNADLLWETLIYGFDTALPPIIRHDGSILVFGNQGSTEVPGRFYRAFIGAYDRDGQRLFVRDLRPFMGAENTKYSLLGIASAAAALDESDNVYVVLGDHLVSIDPQGELRWNRNIGKASDECTARFGSWLPTIIDDHVYVITDGSWFYKFTLDGVPVADVQLPDCTRPEHVIPDATGRLLVPSFDGALVIDQEGQIAWTWPDVRGEMIPFAVGMSGEVYAASQTFRVFDGESELWSVEDLSVGGGGHSGVMVDHMGRAGFFTDFGRLRVISTSERRLTYEAVASGRMARDAQGRTQYAIHLPDGLIVWPGRGHVPGPEYVDTSFIAAVRGKLGPPRQTGWWAAHGDNRNHRRLSRR